MNIKRPFVPAFLNKLDNFLLLNNPSVWAARAHLVFYYSVLFIAALGAVYFVVPNDARSATTVHVWAGLVSIICIIGLVTWLIYLLRFNVFKRFGIINPIATLVEFLLYFVATSFIISFCFVPAVIETAKANKQYTTKELVDDMNNINIKICQLEYDSLPKNWRADTLRIVDTLPKIDTYSAPVDYDTETTATTDIVSTSVSRRQHRVVDTAGLAGLFRNGDSLLRVDDSTYLLFHCPEYTFIQIYNVHTDSSNKLLSSKDIYYMVFKQYVVPDRDKVRSELQLLINKYYYEGNVRLYNEYYSRLYRDKIIQTYKLATVGDGIRNIAERKYRWREHGELFAMLWFYSSLVVTLLIFAFRHSTPRVFFLSLLSVVIIFILTMLLMAFLRRSDLRYYLSLIFYFILFTVISATTFLDEKRTAVKGIATNLFVFMLPFIPVIITGTYYAWRQAQYGPMIDRDLLINHQVMQLHFLLAQIAGPLMFLALLVTYVHRLYRTWFGLPVE